MYSPIQERLVISVNHVKLVHTGAHVQGCQKVFKQQADNEQQAALELTPKAQILRGRGIQGHFENQSLRNGVSRSFQEVFSTTDAMLFCQNKRKTENNAVKMSQAFQDIAEFERLTDLSCQNIHSMSFKTGKRMHYNFIRWCLFFISSYGRRR